MTTARITDRKGEWFDIWYEDRLSMLQTMIRNMTSDLEAGYDYFGNIIRGQRQMIEHYRQYTDDVLEMFKSMDETQVDRWCFYDLKKRGAI